MTNTIYLDNAATTPVLPEVVEIMHRTLSENFGNPSSSHQLGRKSKALVETARKRIADHFKASPSEIIFTSGGSEADNLILYNAVVKYGVKTIISSKIEHHAVLHTLEYLAKTYGTIIKWVQLDKEGSVDYSDLEMLLKETEGRKLVSLMYINNEIGNILDLSKVCSMCAAYDSLFHSDAVQGIGHFDIDVSKTPMDFFVASAHKFHGPKGVGFAYIKKGFEMDPILHGGEQERGARAGTENVHSILGMEKALDIACTNMKEESSQILLIKNYFIERLKATIPGIAFNGRSESEEKSSYIILNVRMPKEIKMLLFNLDLKGVAASGGSACQSGSNVGSHVLNTILSEDQSKNTSVRFSFSKLNTKSEIDRVIFVLEELVK